MLIGRLGKEPEVRYMTSGEAVGNVSLATSEHWKDKSGEKQEKTEWHNLVFYRRLAEILEQYCHKGDHLYIEGKLQTRKWQDKETGKDRYSTEIVVSELQMLGSKKEGNQNERPERKPDPKPGASKPSPEPRKSNFDNFDDDIPFN